MLIRNRPHCHAAAANIAIVHAPLLCVTDVFNVALGDPSRPGKAGE